MKRVTLQNILLPLEERYESCPGLFFRTGPLSIPFPQHSDYSYGMPFSPTCPLPRAQVETEDVRLDAGKGALRIADGLSVSLCTYFNLLSARKWLAYTAVESFVAEIDIEGAGELVFYELGAPDISDKRTFHGHAEVCRTWRVAFDCAQRQTVSVPIAATQAACVGFDVVASGPVVVYGGRYVGMVAETELRDVEICLLTTTYEKEEFIGANLGLLKREIWDSGDEVADHLDVIVVDNGRTLEAADVECDHVRLFPNPNVGGAGGFSRGMIEALRTGKDYTHVLVMDDDVSMHPEAFRRTYALLRIVRDEFASCFVSGAMLRLDEMNVQHEDIGYVHKNGYFMSLKETLDLYDIRDVVVNEVLWDPVPNQYAAWWYCCIPMRYVGDESLPMPFFVRGDDVEFSLRNGVGVISLAGICVWHTGFNKKFAASMEYYQVIRNSLILQACTPHMAPAKFFRQAYELVLYNLYQYAYDYCDLIIDAVEDFMKGPAFLEACDGVSKLKEKAVRNETLVDLAAFEGLDTQIDLADPEAVQRVYVDKQVDLVRRAIRMATINGHFRAPRFFYRDGVGTTPYDWEFTTGNQSGYEQILAINPAEGTGALRIRDQARFDEVMTRLRSVTAAYRRDHRAIERQWQERYPYLTSTAFWKLHLGIE